ncbi:ABC transporter ATP-binding protein [Geomonas edaphica]|nr:ABC transporter ATP-binding protein [Geomonas edaphica]
MLNNISFTIHPGEAIGIVGQNGAGKSTLLKLITGTLLPTTGSYTLSGRVSAILELGMGFNPELTGRQNVYHSAGLMGFHRHEVDQMMPGIEAFAEIGDYFDQPVRIYSSGMQVRVAFSVATAYRPELLIVDEALSVGDTYFQHKSFDRIREFQQQGTSLLIVSHDKAAVQTLCSRAILLDQGSIIKDGAPEEVMDYYNALIAERENQSVQQVLHESGKVQTISGTGQASVTGIGMYNSSGNPVEVVNVGDDVVLKISVTVNTFIPRLVLGYMIKDRLGQPVFGTNTHHTNQPLSGLAPGDSFHFYITFPMRIGPGTYSIATALVDADTHLTNNYEWKDLAFIFSVSNFDKTNFIGSAWIPPQIEIKKL